MTTTVAKFSPNGYWVASADISGKVKVWSWDNPEHLIKLETPVFNGPVLDLDWDIESKKIVAVGDGSTLLAKVFTWDTGNSVGDLMGHTKKVQSVSFKPTRPFKIITAGEDMKTIVYNGPPFKFSHSNAVHTNFANMVRFSSNGSSLVSVGSDKKIQFYDSTTGLPTKEIINAHDGSIFSCSLSDDGSKLLTASADKKLKIWNTDSLVTETVIDISSDPQIGDMQMSAILNGSKIVSLSLNGNINIFSSVESSFSNVIESHQVAITAMYLDRSTSTLFTGSFDGVVISHNLTSGKSQKVKGSDKRHIAGGAHSGKVVALGTINGDLISLGWDDAARFASVSTLAYYDDLPLGIQPVAMAISNTLTALATTNEIILLNGHSKVGSMTNLGYSPLSIAILNDSEVAVGGDDNKIHVYSVNSSYSLSQSNVVEMRSTVSALSYSPCGNIRSTLNLLYNNYNFIFFDN